MSASAVVDRLTSASTQFATADFDPALRDWSFVEPLVVGAGGIGCELLHLLALSGFAHLTVIDMDYIELSNLNRQFLFTQADIGKAKSTVAAAAVMTRCPQVTVTAIVGRLEDQPDSFYEDFDIILLALDSIPARRWINRKVAQLATRSLVPTPASANEEAVAAARPVRSVGLSVIEEAKPIIDTGTEGFEGHCRVLNMRHNTTPCIECEMYLYNDGAARKTVPLCTLESVPRAPEHCVLYVQMKEWPEERGEELDPDNAEHVRWVAERALARQATFGIGGAPIDDMFALGVIKNVVPAVGFTNAYVAGQAVTEALKWLTGCAPPLDNFAFYNGAVEGGIFTDVQQCCAAPTAGGGDVKGRCLVCGPRPVVAVDAARVTPLAFLEALIDLCVGKEGDGEGGSGALSEAEEAAARADLRAGTASLFLPLRADELSAAAVEFPLPRLSVASPPVSAAAGPSCGEAESLAGLLAAAGHGRFVDEWRRGEETATVECFGGTDGARLCVTVQWLQS